MKTRLVFCVIVLGFIFSSTILAKVAFGDGLFMEELSASFGYRKADLIIKMTPPLVTTETLEKQNQKPIVQFKLYDYRRRIQTCNLFYHN